MEKTLKHNYIFLITLLSVFFFSFSNYSFANSSFGWLTHKAEYLGVSTKCSSEEAGLRIALVEKGTKNEITNSAGNWSITIKTQTGGNILHNFSGAQKISDEVCFDPIDDGIKVVVGGSSNYKEFISSTIKSDNTDFDALESMKGNTFRGYLELEKSNSVTPSINLVSPNNTNSNAGSFVVNINSLTSTFSSDHPKSLKLYLINASTNSLETYTVPIPPGFTTGSLTVTPTVDFLNDLDEGVYFWTANTILNGESITQKLTSPAKTWTFEDIPSSGVPNYLTFTLDKSAPTANIHPVQFTNTDPSDPTKIGVSFSGELADSIGLGNYTIVVRDTSNNVVVNRSSVITGKTYNLNYTPTTYPLVKGSDYTITYTITDSAGNSTVVVQNITVPITYEVPDVSLRSPYFAGSGSGYVFYAKVDDRATNTLTPKQTTVCYTKDSSNFGTDYKLINPQTPPINVQCLPILDVGIYTFYSNLPSVSTYTHFHRSTTASTFEYNQSYHYFVAVKNDFGWGYSALRDFTTAPNPFNDPLSVEVPDISLAKDTYRPFTSSTSSIQLKIKDPKGSEIEYHGICYALSDSSLNLMDYTDTAALDSNSNCVFYGNSGSTVAQPNFDDIDHTVNTLDHIDFRSFGGQIANTTYYYRGFAKNANGIGFASMNLTTAMFFYDLFNLDRGGSGILENGDSPYLKSTTYDSGSGLFSEVRINIGIGESNSDRICNQTPSSLIPFRVTLSSNDSSSSYTETISGSLGYSSTPSAERVVRVARHGVRHACGTEVYDIVDSNFRTLTFTNVPPGQYKVVSEIDPNNVFSPATSTPSSYVAGKRVVERVFTLETPANITSDTLENTTQTSGGDLQIDPELKLSATPNLIVSGSSANLTWEMLNVAGSLECKILGASGASDNEVDSFSHTYDPGLGSSITGNITTDKLYNSQKFKFSCTNPVTGTSYETTAKVTVIGKPFEI